MELIYEYCEELSSRLVESYDNLMNISRLDLKKNADQNLIVIVLTDKP
jgi:hypothetical protein